MSYLFTSESVSEGHPDKVADQISDALVDHFIAFDAESKVACETLVTTGQVILAGEVKSKTYIDAQEIARDVIRKIGYTKSEYMFEANSCGVLSAIHEQSPDINQGVDRASKEEQGAGDQGIMFGYASNETKELMPAAVMFAHRIGRQIAKIRHAGRQAKWLRPDCKSQVSIRYEGDKAIEITAVVISTQHTDDVRRKDIEKFMIEKVIKKCLPKSLLTKNTQYLINPTGRFVIGGPQGDAGLTGRKIIVDTYGGSGRHGGGAFSGKDPSKVDRSAAYMCRWVAKNIVAAKLADRAELQVAYAIGHPEPVSITVDTFGTGKVDEEVIEAAVTEVFDFKPAGIVRQLKLKQPIYRSTTNYGHFGKDYLSWEQTNKATALARAVKKLSK